MVTPHQLSLYWPVLLLKVVLISGLPVNDCKGLKSVAKTMALASLWL